MPQIVRDVPLAPLTTLRVGGPAQEFVEVHSDEEFIDVVRSADSCGQQVLLIAGGSNLVIGDDGFNGLTVHVRSRGIDITLDGDDVLVRAAAGESWDRLVAQLVADGYSGIETLSGIPGSVGATPVQNVGAYGNEVAEVIASVEVLDRTTGERETFAAQECDFAYRGSVFKANPSRWLILAVTLRLTGRAESVPIKYAELAKALGIAPGDTTKPIQVRRAVLDVRRRKSMVIDIDDHDCWSAGSFFTNPVVDLAIAQQLPEDAPRWPTDSGLVKLSAAWLIEHAGFGRGWAMAPGARAALSTKHTLAITNRGGATTREICGLARAVTDGVYREFGIELRPEPNLINCTI